MHRESFLPKFYTLQVYIFKQSVVLKQENIYDTISYILATDKHSILWCDGMKFDYR